MAIWNEASWLIQPRRCRTTLRWLYPDFNPLDFAISFSTQTHSKDPHSGYLYGCPWGLSRFIRYRKDLLKTSLLQAAFAAWLSLSSLP